MGAYTHGCAQGCCVDLLPQLQPAPAANPWWDPFPLITCPCPPPFTQPPAPGTIPHDLCLPNFQSPLTDLFIGSNQLTGTLDLTFCRELILVDATVGRAGCGGGGG